MKTVKLPATLWAGFEAGRMDVDAWHGCVAGAGAYYGVLYTSKREALKHYEDVRKVIIKEVKGGKHE